MAWTSYFYMCWECERIFSGFIIWSRKNEHIFAYVWPLIHVYMHHLPSAGVLLIISYLPICMKQVEMNISQKPNKTIQWREKRNKKQFGILLGLYRHVWGCDLCGNIVSSYSVNCLKSFAIKLTFDAIFCSISCCS